MILIEACIGLFFLYLILSLIASFVLELIAAAAKMRAKKLIKAIESIFDESPDDSNKSELYKAFFDHPLYKQLCNPQKGEEPRRPPSYIEPSTFVEIIISILSTNNLTYQSISSEAVDSAIKQGQNEAFKETLHYYLKKTGGDIEELRKELENWFNNIMNRVSGWYKRKTQRLLFAIGLVMAIFLNVNSIYVFESLLKDNATRELVVEQAVDFKENRAQTLLSLAQIKADSSKNDAEKLTATLNAMDSLLKSEATFPFSNLGMGWLHQSNKKFCDEWKPAGIGKRVAMIFFLLIGWFISALAISLGAPFWFDSLVYLINMRGAGKTLFDKKNPMVPQTEKTITKIEVNTTALKEDEEIRKKPVG